MKLSAAFRVPSIVTIVGVLVASAGCDARSRPDDRNSGAEIPTDERDSRAAIKTDALRYRLTETPESYRVDIPYVFTNRTGRDVFLTNCNGALALQLEKQVGGEWNAAWSPVLSACLSAPIVIGADETYGDTVRLLSGKVGSTVYPQFGTENPEGTYRIVWSGALFSFGDESSFRDTIPRSERTSNDFLISLN